MESVADFVVAGIRIIIDNTNLLAEKNNGKVNSLTYLYLTMLNRTLKPYFASQTKWFPLRKCYLCIVYTHAESLNGQRLGRHTYGIRRNCTLWF